jgi:hypothetical protein
VESLGGGDRQSPFAQRPLVIKHRAEIAHVEPASKEVKLNRARAIASASQDAAVRLDGR